MERMLKSMNGLDHVINLNAAFDNYLLVVFNLYSIIIKNGENVKHLRPNSPLTDYGLPSTTTPRHWVRSANEKLYRS